MRGKRALWIPGTDHAAIATQVKVEQGLIKKGDEESSRGTWARKVIEGSSEVR